MTKSELEYKHGTPEEYAEAQWLMCENLIITPADAKERVFEYWKEWEAAE